jgi:hypothetical protein
LSLGLRLSPLVALVLVGVARAQEPPGPDAAPRVPRLDGQILPANPPDESATPGQPHYAAAQLLLGLPSPARLQAPLYQEAGHSFLLEFSDRGTLTAQPVSGVAGGGRLNFTLVGDAAGKGLVVGPGLDLWTVNSVNEVVVAPTLDITLMQDLRPRCGWEFGLNVGAGYFCGRPADYGFPRVFPLFGLYTGFKF